MSAAENAITQPNHKAPNAAIRPSAMEPARQDRLSYRIPRGYEPAPATTDLTDPPFACPPD